MGLNAHKIRQQQTDQKCLDETLDHNPYGLIVAVEVADHTEQDSRYDGFQGKALEVFEPFLDDFRIR